MMDCPACGDSWRGAASLVRHCREAHRVPEMPDKAAMSCPCGWVEDYDGKSSWEIGDIQFIAHCEEHGGVLEHLTQMLVLRALMTGGRA